MHSVQWVRDNWVTLGWKPTITIAPLSRTFSHLLRLSLQHTHTHIMEQKMFSLPVGAGNIFLSVGWFSQRLKAVPDFPCLSWRIQICCSASLLQGQCYRETFSASTCMFPLGPPLFPAHFLPPPHSSFLFPVHLTVTLLCDSHRRDLYDLRFSDVKNTKWKLSLQYAISGFFFIVQYAIPPRN